MRLILSILVAFVLLFLGANTAVYFLRLGPVEKELTAVTEMALAEKMGERFKPDQLKVNFRGLKGSVTGVVGSDQTLTVVRRAVEEIAATSLVTKAGTGVRQLTHDVKRTPQFHAWVENGKPYWNAYLAEPAFEEVRAALLAETGIEPEPPFDSSVEGLPLPIIMIPDAAEPSWQNDIGEFVRFYFEPDRLNAAELYVSGEHEVVLRGIVESEAESEQVLERAKKFFPNTRSIVNEIDPNGTERPPFVLIQGPDKAVSLEAQVFTQELKDRLIDLIRDQGAQGQPLAGAISVSPRGVKEIPWLEERPTFFRDLLLDLKAERLKGFKMAIGPYSVTLHGEAPSQRVAEALGSKVQSQLSGHTLHNQLKYPPVEAVPLAE